MSDAGKPDRFAALTALEKQAGEAGGAVARRAPAPGRQADRARAGRAVLRSRQLRRARQAGHPPLDRLRPRRQQDPGRRRDHRLRHRPRPHGLPVRAGLHRVRRLAGRGARAQDLQGHGPGHEGRRADRRAQRFGRRAHSRRGRLAGRLRRHLPAQHAGLGAGAAALRRARPLRGGRGLLAGHHRLRLHGRVDEPHVHHRPGRDPRRHARDRHQGRAGGRGGARPLGRRPPRLPRRAVADRGAADAALVPAAEQPRRSPAPADARSRRPRRPAARRADPE